MEHLKAHLPDGSLVEGQDLNVILKVQPLDPTFVQDHRNGVQIYQQTYLTLVPADPQEERRERSARIRQPGDVIESHGMEIDPVNYCISGRPDGPVRITISEVPTDHPGDEPYLRYEVEALPRTLPTEEGR